MASASDEVAWLVYQTPSGTLSLLAFKADEVSSSMSVSWLSLTTSWTEHQLVGSKSRVGSGLQ